jgi:hypothetical protein
MKSSPNDFYALRIVKKYSFNNATFTGQDKIEEKIEDICRSKDFGIGKIHNSFVQTFSTFESPVS